jgi:hypothetical protein
MDGNSVLLGILGCLSVVVIFLLGNVFGRLEVRDMCETYGKARVGAILFTCQVPAR